MKKLRSKLSTAYALLLNRIGRIQLNYTDIAVKAFLIVLIITLGYNVYTSYSKGQSNLARIAEEEARLEKLVKEQKSLKNLEQYYSSIEYRRTYARDSLNLAEPGSTLYFIERREDQKIDHYKINEDPIPLGDHALWWRKLILGG